MRALPLKLLLLSNSRNPEGEYLVHAAQHIAALVAGNPATRALFIPFAGVTVSWPDYTAMVQQALAPHGITVVPAFDSIDLSAALAKVDMVLVGGGNTFHLLRELRRRGWLAVLREAVYGGLPYVGWSAGSNLACPTIRTTNDMPIVDPMGLDALGLVPFQINAHYTNELPPGLQAETREQRLREFLEANPALAVCALPEGSWVEVDNDRCTAGGEGNIYWYDAQAISAIPTASSWPLRGSPMRSPVSTISR